jgi:hypothetical protein
MQDVWRPEPAAEEESSVQTEAAAVDTGSGVEASTEEAVRGVTPSPAPQERPSSRPVP